MVGEIELHQGLDRLEKFWEELKKRNVVRAFLFYVVAAWLIIQFATATFPYLNFPPWAIQAVIITLLIGAPVVLIVSWIYELTTEGLRKTDSVDREKSISVKTGKKINQLTIVILSLAVVFLLVDKFYLSASNELESERTKSIAVFPFSIQGGGDIQYLKDGMVDLISSKLDAMPGLNATDPNIILGVANTKGLDNRNPVAAAKAASGLGANRVILGSITQIGDQLQVKISKYDKAGRPIGDPIIEDGTAAELYGRVDNIIKRLVADELNEQGNEFDSEAVLTTNKLESIVPFLQGMQLARVGKHEEALNAYRESIEADTSFVLGYFRYIENAGWISAVHSGSRKEKEYDPYFKRLEKLSADLKGKNGELVRASLKWLNSDISSEKEYLRLLNKYGESVEILNGLAESIFHLSEIIAADRSKAKPYFERLIELDPTKDEYLDHIMDISERAGDVESFNAYADRINPESYQQYSLDFRRFMMQDSVSDADIMELSKSLKPSFGFIADKKIEALRGLEVAKRVRAVNSEFSSIDFWIEFMETSISGQHDEAFQKAFELFEQYGGLERNMLLSLVQISFDGMPIWSKYAKDLIPKIEATKRFFSQMLPGIPPLELDYLVALGYIYDNRLDKAHEKLDGLRGYFDDETVTPFGKARDQARLLYYNLAGILAYTEGKDDRAKIYFDSAVTRVKRVELDYAIAMAKPRNFHLAEFKIRDENYEEALNIYLNTLESHGMSVAPMGFSWGFNVYRIAQMYDKLDRKEEAIAYYKTFVNAYQNADEMYQGWIDDANSRLSVLVERPEEKLEGEITNSED